MFKTIVVGTDGSDTAARAVDQAMEMARIHGATLHVVTAYRPLSEREVYERQRGLSPAKAAAIDEATHARELLQSVASSATAAGVSVELHGRPGDPGNALVQVIKDVEADLVVVGNRGMTGLRRVLGSVPNHVAHAAPCTVMIVDTT